MALIQSRNDGGSNLVGEAELVRMVRSAVSCQRTANSTVCGVRGGLPRILP